MSIFVWFLFAALLNVGNIDCDTTTSPITSPDSNLVKDSDSKPAFSTNLIDPIAMFFGMTEDFFRKINVHEQRQKHLSDIKGFLQKIPHEQADYLSKPQNLKLEVLSKNSGLPGGAKISSELALQVQDLIDEAKATWKNFQDKVSDYIDFLQSNKELIDEKAVTEFWDSLDAKGKFDIDFLINLEKQYSNISSEIDSLRTDRATLNVQKAEESSLFESLKKEDVELDAKQDKDLLLASNGTLSEKPETSLVLFKKNILYEKQRLTRLKVEQYNFIINIFNNKIDLLKIKQKTILESALKRVKANVIVTQTDLNAKVLAFKQEEKVVNSKISDITRELANVKSEVDRLGRLYDEFKRRLADSKTKLTNLKDGISDIEAQVEILTYEIIVEKISLDREVVLQQKLFLELQKKNLLLDLSLNNWLILRAEAYFNLNIGNERELLILLKRVKEVEIPEISKRYEGVGVFLANIENFLITTSVNKKLALREKRELLLGYKKSLFDGLRQIYQENQVGITEAEKLLDDLIKKNNESRLLVISFDKKKKNLLENFENLKKEIEGMIGLKNLVARSPYAISLDDISEAKKALISFSEKFIKASQVKWNIFALWSEVKHKHQDFWLGFLVTILLFFFGGLICIFLLEKARNAVDLIVSRQYLRFDNRWFLLLLIILNLFYDYFSWMYSWIFIHVGYRYNLKILGFSLRMVDSYYICFFYLLSAVMFLWLSYQLLEIFKSVNQRMSYFFFSERNTTKNTFLLRVILYSTSLVYPLWRAVASFSPYFKESPLATVLIAAYMLLIALTIFLYLEKEDLIGFVPHYGKITWMIRRFIDRFYYPVFAFMVFILILWSPYIGYANLGWFLLLRVPVSVAIISGIIFLQSYSCEYIQQFFLTESDVDGEVLEKFDNARMFYGISIVGSFLLACLLTFVTLSFLWLGSFYLDWLWRHLNEVWTIPFGEKSRFGLVQLFVFITSLLIGYLISSAVDRYVLRKVFEVFRLDAGLENTISKIFQYFAIVISIVIAFVVINLTDFIKYLLLLVGVGISLGMRDQISDIFAGILILLERQIEIGHFIEFQKNRGTVHKISVRSTIIRTTRNFFVSIPNRLLISHPIENWGAGRVAVGIVIDIRVSYGCDPDLVCVLIKKALYDNAAILRVPAATSRLEEFSDYGMNFQARGFISARKVRDQWDIASAIRLDLIKRFKQNSIELAYQNVVVHWSKAVAEDQQNKVPEGLTDFDKDNEN